MELVQPSQETLDKYGLTVERWLYLAEKQGFVCAICGKLPKTCRLNIDHEHVKGWKKMAPEERVGWVRGLLCFWCNKSYCGRSITVEKAKAMVVYLEQRPPFKPTLLPFLDQAV